MAAEQGAHAGLLAAWRSAAAAGKPVPGALVAALGAAHAALLAPRLARMGNCEARTPPAASVGGTRDGDRRTHRVAMCTAIFLIW
jgi:hypothetical protein